ncbi:helix-turn-helix domain-containing protein [Alkalibacillus salilacus]|uniref:Transcriptional regulator with XRE-family HTH domain n=1 Tax=Alkalibacillus salilacus TaxID=284582 RepID=A0ABT9VIS4_9BACI|nr:helix-turn-helix transcriptional regulator [Alkalibacillus salilacus]MDQ0160745.1 transcriptional regulator with XRE-family HTH domain [Alkalibacillus salilacus]
MESEEFVFGKIVQRHRLGLGWSLSHLGKQIGNVSAPYLNRLERGEKRNPSFTLAMDLIRVLNIDLKEVLFSLGYTDMEIDIDDQTTSIDEIIRVNDLALKDEDFQIELHYNEKEKLIHIIRALTHYISEPYEQIYQVIEESEQFKSLLNERSHFSVSINGNEYDVDIDSDVYKRIDYLRDLKESISTSLHERADIADIHDDSFTLDLPDKKVLCVKYNRQIKVVSLLD